MLKEKSIDDIRPLVQINNDASYKNILNMQIENRKKRLSSDPYMLECDYNYPVYMYSRDKRRVLCIKTLIPKGKYYDGFGLIPKGWSDGEKDDYFVDMNFNSVPNEAVFSEKLEKLKSLKFDNMFMYIHILPHTSVLLKSLAVWICGLGVTKMSLYPAFQDHEKFVVLRFSRVEKGDDKFSLKSFLPSREISAKTYLMFSMMHELFRLEVGELRYMYMLQSGTWLRNEPLFSPIDAMFVVGDLRLTDSATIDNSLFDEQRKNKRKNSSKSQRTKNIGKNRHIARPIGNVQAPRPLEGGLGVNVNNPILPPNSASPPIDSTSLK